MRLMLAHLTRFLKREDGPTAVEYAVMLALIIVVSVGAITVLGGKSRDTFANVSTSTASSNIPIGGTAKGGTAVSSGIFTSQNYVSGHSEMYNAATNDWTYTNGSGNTFTDHNSNPGHLPGGSSVTWTRIE